MASVTATAKVTSKGQVTIPLSLRRQFGIRTGDQLRFEPNHNAMLVRVEHKGKSAFAEYQGIGNPGIGSSRREILTWVRRLRRG